MSFRSTRSNYTVSDFQQWRENGALVLTPKFQRRSVWSTPKKSYLIDTVLRGLPVPPIFLRVRQSDDRKKTIREVIDGQQRITALLDFVEGKFRLSRGLDAGYAGKTFDKLTDDEKDQFAEYSFICEVFQGIDDASVLEIFARVNTHAVQLNAQELRNGQFFGQFKTAAYLLAHEHIEFWRRHRILSEQAIARMKDAELVSELLVAQLAGMQDKKKSLDQFYKDNDENFAGKDKQRKRFRVTIDEIEKSLGEDLEDTVFRRTALFYTLYCVVFHRLFGIPEIALKRPSKKMSSVERTALRDAVIAMSDAVENGGASGRLPARVAKFVNAALRQTDNIKPRLARFEALYRQAF